MHMQMCTSGHYRPVNLLRPPFSDLFSPHLRAAATMGSWPQMVRLCASLYVCVCARTHERRLRCVWRALRDRARVLGRECELRGECMPCCLCAMCDDGEFERAVARSWLCLRERACSVWT